MKIYEGSQLLLVVVEAIIQDYWQGVNVVNHEEYKQNFKYICDVFEVECSECYGYFKYKDLEVFGEDDGFKNIVTNKEVDTVFINQMLEDCIKHFDNLAKEINFAPTGIEGYNKLVINIEKFNKNQEDTRRLNEHNLEDIIWIHDDLTIEKFTKEEIEKFKFTGLGNKNFLKFVNERR